MSKITHLFLFVLLCLAVSLPTYARSPGDYRMVLILPGPTTDQSWSAANYAGLQASNAKLGTRMEYVENVRPSDYESTFRNYAERGYELILAAGTQFDDSAIRVAPRYPRTTFCVINGAHAVVPNVCPVMAREYEASFLAGLIAGQTTRTGKIGLVGGFPNKLMIRLLNTYEWGARFSRPELQVTRAYAHSWTDIALGKQLGASMIDNGADVLFFYANQVGLGGIIAAREKKAAYVGFASNQNDMAPETVVASVYFDFSSLYTWTVDRFLKGELKPVLNEVGVAEGIVKVAYSDSVTPETRELVSRGERAVMDMNLLFFLSGSPEAVQ